MPNLVISDAQNGPIRAFFGLSLSHGSLHQLAKLRDSIYYASDARKVMRPVPDEAMHLTVKFLGNVARDAVADFTSLLMAVAPSLPFRTEVKGIEGFGFERRAKVLALELVESTGELMRCVEGLELGAERIGIPREARAFRPHITLVRLKHPLELKRAVAGVQVPPISLQFEALRLYSSQATPNGSKYVEIAGIDLPR